jgi:membrane-bound inhibitor of C-type lysozyme
MSAFRLPLCLALALAAAPLLAEEEAPGVLPAADAPAAAAAAPTVYRCAGGKTLRTTVDASDADRPRTLLSVDGDAALQGIALLDVPSANGNKTSNGKLVWWTKGDEGFLAEEEAPAGNGEVLIAECREAPATP